MSASQNVKHRRTVDVVALALNCHEDGKFMLARRSPGSSGAGQWEFPGGKIESGETQKQALIREIKEELDFDIDARGLIYVGENFHSYPEKHIRIYLWKYLVKTRPVFKLTDHDIIEWFRQNELKEINLSDADKYFISLI